MISTWKFLLLVCVLLPLSVIAKPLKIAIVLDGDRALIRGMVDIVEREISVLLSDDTKTEFRVMHSNFDDSQYQDTLNSAYRAKEIDMVVVLGIGTTQAALVDRNFIKPTFLPNLFAAQFYGLPTENGSGIKNLNYLAGKIQFSDDLNFFKSIMPLKKVAFLVDGNALDLLPVAMTQSLVDMARSKGIELSYVKIESTNVGEIVTAIPIDVDAIITPAIPQLDNFQITSLFNSLARKNIAAFSLADIKLLELGALGSTAPKTDVQRMARTLGFNLLATFRGQNPASLTVQFDRQNRLSVNAEAARLIGIAIPFDVLTSVEVINQDPVSDEIPLTLTSVAEIALASNLNIIAQITASKIASLQLDEAKSPWKPQLNLGGNYNQRKESTSTINEVLAEETGSVSVSLSQQIYSEALSSSVDLSQYNVDIVDATLRQTELDIIQNATVAFLNYLKAKNNLAAQRNNTRLSQENLRQAKQKLQIGSGTRSAVLNWQSQVANARQNLLSVQSGLRQARESLNIILNRGPESSYNTTPTSIDYPNSLAGNRRLDQVINNPKALDAMGRVMQEHALNLSPELKRLKLQIAAKRRELQSARSSRWSPDISANLEVSDIYHDSRSSTASQEGDVDWIVSLQLNLPIYQGGKIGYRHSRVRAEIYQLDTEYKLLAQQITQNVRQNLHALRASFPAIEFAKDAADSSNEAFELMQVSYDEGSVSILDLIDAQNNAINAEQQANNATFDMMIDMMNLQRSYGEFDFFIDEESRQSFIDEVISRIN